jgi:hypothetical protein
MIGGQRWRSTQRMIAKPSKRKAFEGLVTVRWVKLRRRSRSSPHGLAVSSRVRCDRPVSRLWVARSRFAVPGRAGHAVFPSGRRGRMGLISANAPLIEFRRPTGSCTDDASPARHQSFDRRERDTSSAFVPYGTSGVRGPVHAGVACPPPSVRRVWVPSRRLAPSRALPAFFRAGSACGILPSERSPRPRLPGVTAVARPACRYRESHPDDRGHQSQNRRPATGYYLERVPSHHAGV